MSADALATEADTVDPNALAVSTDGSTVDRWLEGDEAATKTLYVEHRTRTFRLALGLLGDAAEAEDVAQQVLARVLLEPRRFDPTRGTLATWINVVTVSRCRDRLRRRRRRTTSFWSWLRRGNDVPDPRPHAELQVETRQEHQRVMNALEQLPGELREAVVLRFWGHHTYREVAEAVGCPLRTAQSRVRLGVMRMRALLEETP